MLNRACIISVMALLGSSIAPAATVVYTNRDAFFGMVAPGSYTEGFERAYFPHPPEEIPSPQNF